MPEEEQSTRDRVRALVREVLQNAAPAEEGGDAQFAPAQSQGEARASSGRPQGGARVVNVAPDAPAMPEREYARDESSKSVITETDVRGLPEGARLRVAEGARLTPLAADIVRERRIELVRRVPRRGPAGGDVEDARALPRSARRRARALARRLSQNALPRLLGRGRVLEHLAHERAHAITC